MLSNPFRPAAVDPGRLRQEIFALGDRHRGDALKGARRELGDPGLSVERRRLLLAVVAHFDRGGTGGEGAAARNIRKGMSLTDAAYLGIVIGSVGWIVATARNLIS